MRTRDEIEKDAAESGRVVSQELGQLYGRGPDILEVLLDIRDLLTKTIQ